jgi:hypothetical protein
MGRVCDVHAGRIYLIHDSQFTRLLNGCIEEEEALKEELPIWHCMENHKSGIKNTFAC